MDTIIIFNGLGNQMSQYALFLAKKAAGQAVSYMSISNDHNGYELDRLFGIPRLRGSRILATLAATRVFWSRRIWIAKTRDSLSKALGFERYDEKFNYDFQRAAVQQGDHGRYLLGGWHSEQYFVTAEDEIRETFQFPAIIDDKNNATLQQIRSSRTVSIHVRRGDYLNSTNGEVFGSVCDAEFYRRAIAEMQSRLKSFQLVVFSNDFAWARSNIQADDILFVDWNHGYSSWIDMFLMSQCEHHIVCNSTFGWWGAWLNPNAGKVVVCPDRFIATERETQVFPNSWIRVNTGDARNEAHRRDPDL